MDDSLDDVMRLLGLAQTGNREQALALADERLAVAESPGMLYARAVALHSIGDHEGAAATAERMLELTAHPEVVATRAPSTVTGWRSIALAYRAWQHLRSGKTSRHGSDLESIMHDLAQAEVMLTSDVTDPFAWRRRIRAWETAITSCGCMSSPARTSRPPTLPRPPTQTRWSSIGR